MSREGAILNLESKETIKACISSMQHNSAHEAETLMPIGHDTIEIAHKTPMTLWRPARLREATLMAQHIEMLMLP